MFVPRSDPTYRMLSDLLIGARKERGMLQSDVAAALKIHQQVVSKIEAGERRIDVVEFIKYAEILGLDPTDAVRILTKKS